MRIKRGKNVVFPKVRLLSTPFRRAKGLMFSPRLKRGEALFFPLKYEGVAGAAIHMLFVFFPIEAIWLDKEMRVVDKKVAKPFGLFYAPEKPASYLIEAGLGSGVKVGDRLVLEK